MCSLELQSWSRTKREIIVNYDHEKPYMNHSFIKTEWNLLKLNVTRKEENDFTWLEFTIYLRRNHAFYCNSIILFLKTSNQFIHFF